MDFELISSIEEFDNNLPQQSFSLNMNTTNDSNNNIQNTSQNSLLWNTTPEFNKLDDMLGILPSTQQPQQQQQQHNNNNNSYSNPLNSLTQTVSDHLPPHPNTSTLPSPSPLATQQNFLSVNLNPQFQHHHHQSIQQPIIQSSNNSTTSTDNNNNNTRKRKYSTIKDERNIEQNNKNTSISTTNTISDTTSLNQNNDDDQLNNVPAIASLNEPLIIDRNMLVQLGGLPYAELCKERAREAFKEAKKNEHIKNGNLDRMKRRKKGDTSMTPREKYVRRLRMNQDSAAAARHAQEVYVSVLERLVRTSESEKKTFLVEVQQVHNQNDQLKSKVHELNMKIKQLEKQQQQQQNDNNNNNNSNNKFEEDKKHHPDYARIMELFKDTGNVGAQPDIGVQPARAV